MAFPKTRMRRLRATHQLRGLVRETQLSVSDLIYPLFVAEGLEGRAPIWTMPGIDRLSVEEAVAEAGAVAALGIPGVILFGIPAHKDPEGTGAYDDLNGIVQVAVRAIKDAHPELIVVTDLCLCEYTDHGHCGVLRPQAGARQGAEPAREVAAGQGAEPARDLSGGRRGAEPPVCVDNDATLELLARTAVSQARAGADIVAPSDMMDGRVGAIREALDEAGLTETPIMAYSSKFASAFYGPFRAAADSAPVFGDRRSYQMDPANGAEAVRESLLDVEEGADMVMVKPALPYLDIIRRVREATALPLVAYNTGGEYSMLKAAAAAGYMDERQSVLEALTGIRRAGADIIITYHAKDAAEWLK